MKARLFFILALAFIATSPTPGHGFVCLRSPGGSCLHWADAATTLRSFLGAAGQPLINGTLNWDQNAQGAAGDWNAAGVGFRFTVVVGGQLFDPCACPTSGPRGDNPVLFSAVACGGGFGDIVAETQNCFDRQTGQLINSGVFMNSAVAWNAYDGPLRFPVNDIRRVLLHEFGHVLGLAHPDDAGQVVNAIMNSRESDLDRLADDDIFGARSIYGGSGGGGGGPANNSCAIAPTRRSSGWWFWLTVGLALLACLARGSTPGRRFSTNVRSDSQFQRTPLY
jgi:hypothetical protein